jgi:hypothetical protein
MEGKYWECVECDQDSKANLCPEKNVPTTHWSNTCRSTRDKWKLIDRELFRSMTNPR